MFAFRSALDCTQSLISILNRLAESAEFDHNADFWAFWYFLVPVRSKTRKRWHPWCYHGTCTHTLRKNWAEGQQQYALPSAWKPTTPPPPHPSIFYGHFRFFQKTSDIWLRGRNRLKYWGKFSDLWRTLSARRHLTARSKYILLPHTEHKSGMWILPNSWTFEPVCLA